MAKAQATNYFIRNINGSLSELVNARQEISRGASDYGVYWKFTEISRERFLDEVEKGNYICCIRSKSNKFYEIDKSDLEKYII